MKLKIVAFYAACSLIAGMIAESICLPALVGFLVAGFFLPGLEVYTFSSKDNLKALLEALSELGISLMLFSIGLKLDLRSLLKKEMLAATLVPVVAVISIGCLLLSAAGTLGVTALSSLSTAKLACLSFVLSFSSTILAVKSLQEDGALGSLNGHIATAVLILQDVLAVIFLTLAECTTPSAWCLLLLLLPWVVKPLLYWLINRLGHNEMLILGTLVMVLVSSFMLFGSLGISADLGALVFGCLFSSHPRASEMSKSVASLKELFLVACFLQLGAGGIPNAQGWVIAAIFLILLLVKFFSTFLVLLFFGFRTRTSLLASFRLTNFSEFGLIVAAKVHWMDNKWGTILAIATAGSMILFKPLGKILPKLCQWLVDRRPDERTANLHPDDQLIDLGATKILVLGMGRVGSGAYDELQGRYGEIVTGVELIADEAKRHTFAGRYTINADATDSDFWIRILPEHQVEVILLTLSNCQANLIALTCLKEFGYKGRIAAIVNHEDDRIKLRAAGIDAVFNVYSEAGSGFASHLIDVLNLDESIPINPKRSILSAI